MNNAPNKSHVPCQSWSSQAGWPPPAPQALFNTLPASQHLSMGASCVQSLSYQGLQTPGQSCMIGLTTSASAHHSSLFRNSLSSSLIPGLSDPATQTSCHGVPFDQGTPQKNHAAQLCGAQQLQLLSPHDPYKSMRHQVLPAQGSSGGLEDVPDGLPSCGRQHENANQPPSGGGGVEFAQPAGSVRRHSSAPQKQCQWVPPPAGRGNVCRRTGRYGR